MDWLWLLLLTPLVTGGVVWRLKTSLCAWASLAGAALMLIAGLAVVCLVASGSPLSGWDGMIYVDVLGAFNLGLVVFVGFTAAVYSVGHMATELADGAVSVRQYHQFYSLLHLFFFSMIAVSVVNSIGLMWVGIELTTVVTALLVGLTIGKPRWRQPGNT